MTRGSACERRPRNSFALQDRVGRRCAHEHRRAAQHCLRDSGRANSFLVTKGTRLRSSTSTSTPPLLGRQHVVANGFRAAFNESRSDEPRSVRLTCHFLLLTAGIQQTLFWVVSSSSPAHRRLVSDVYPVFIGINWLFLIYPSNSLQELLMPGVLPATVKHSRSSHGFTALTAQTVLAIHSLDFRREFI
jgi:hypothetical protein